ncbi:TPA: hypothetical protein DEP90_02675 [Patescibacteria group bacterium]|nr:hypothetical protein [Patescibacteria group bacterium]
MNDQMVLVVGGPGGSGSSTIAKRLAKYFNIKRIYGGEYFRKEAKSRGFDSLEAFYKRAKEEDIKKIDQRVDNHFRDLAKKGGVLIESKIFSGIATKEKISCTSKIWITASLDVRVERVLGKEKIRGFLRKWFRRREIINDLTKRYEYDKERYHDLYGIDYDSPNKYNDLVIDSSHQVPDETFSLIINFLNNGKGEE